MKKKKAAHGLPALCLAVKRVREVYGDSQERFARRIGVALMTVSRFETGRAEPRDPRVLLNLAKIAEEISDLPTEDEREQILQNIIGPREPVDVMTVRGAVQLFRDAYEDYERIKQTDRRVGELESHAHPAPRSMREWRLSCAACLAVHYFPEQVAAMEKAAGAAISIIDEVLSKADENQIDYARFEREVFALAERRALLELKQGRKEQ
jgi:transcriptional regulator with XRE-family HTH domain